ncbi:MAG: Tetratricopeptide repeat, partial [Verrucomicrobiota bacterium]
MPALLASYYFNVRESEDRRGSESIRQVARREFLRHCRRWLSYAAATAIFLYSAYCGYAFWQKGHLERQARAFFQKRDYKGAILVTRHLLQIDENNAAACRIMAETATLAGRSEAIGWYQRLIAVEPSVDNQLSLASTALHFGQFKMCRDAIERIPKAARGKEQWHQLAGAVALAEKNTVTAENEFAAALKLAPGDPQIALNLATVRL